MLQESTIITFPVFFGMGQVNCYLLPAGDGYVLVDTAGPNGRARLEQALTAAGCAPGALRLIFLTHGDFDHVGNAASLRARYGAPIAMHRGDLGMVARGDMFAGRQRSIAIVGRLLPLVAGFGRAERFEPDLFLDEGDDLREYGLDARVLHLPGHSSGSIGLLLPGGDLYCGDLLVSTNGPSSNTIVDDAAALQASIGRLRDLGVSMVYPGHGEPFPLEALLESRERAA